MLAIHLGTPLYLLRFGDFLEVAHRTQKRKKPYLDLPACYNRTREHRARGKGAACTPSPVHHPSSTSLHSPIRKPSSHTFWSFPEGSIVWGGLSHWSLGIGSLLPEGQGRLTAPGWHLISPATSYIMRLGSQLSRSLVSKKLLRQESGTKSKYHPIMSDILSHARNWKQRPNTYFII